MSGTTNASSRSFGRNSRSPRFPLVGLVAEGSGASAEEEERSGVLGRERAQGVASYRHRHGGTTNHVSLAMEIRWRG